MPEPVATTGPTVPVSDGEPEAWGNRNPTGEKTPWKEDQPQWTGLFNWGRPNTKQTSIYNKKSLIRDDM